MNPHDLETFSDEELMLAYRDACERDDEPIAARAFALIYDRWSSRVHGFVAARIGRGAFAEEIVQKVFINLHRCAPRYVVSAKLSTLLFTFATRRIADHLDRERLRRHESLDTPVSSDEDSRTKIELVRSEDAHDEQAHHARDVFEALLAMLSNMENQRDARCFILYKLEGWSAPEVAEELDMPLGTVRSCVRRVLAAVELEIGPLWRGDRDRRDEFKGHKGVHKS